MEFPPRILQIRCPEKCFSIRSFPANALYRVCAFNFDCLSRLWGSSTQAYLSSPGLGCAVSHAASCCAALPRACQQCEPECLSHKCEVWEPLYAHCERPGPERQPCHDRQCDILRWQYHFGNGAGCHDHFRGRNHRLGNPENHPCPAWGQHPQSSLCGRRSNQLFRTCNGHRDRAVSVGPSDCLLGGRVGLYPYR